MNEKSEMETNEIANKPQEGTYEEMTPTGERKPKIAFEINEPVEVTFSPDFKKPRELPSQDKGVYYIFDCMCDGEEQIFMTAAWSLLQGLKDCEPLKGKTIVILKTMKDGKQNYGVEDLTNPKVPVEKVGDEKETDKKDSEDESKDNPEETTGEE